MADATITVYIMGKQYAVPRTLTIMRAMEFAGYRLVRGCGCRGGFCGGCGTVWRTQDDYKIKFGLACQTIVEDGMFLAQIPIFPANKTAYKLDELKPSMETILALYPEVFRCLACNTCTKACPQDIEVMDYVQALLRGDIARAADLSFDCLMCGLCAARCPAEIVQFNAAILARRLYGRHLVPPAGHLKQRVEEILAKKFEPEIASLMKAETKKLKELYNKRDIEPE